MSALSFDYYEFDVEYFDLPFTTDPNGLETIDTTAMYNLVYVRRCKKGLMVFSLTHKHFMYEKSKEATKLKAALETYANKKDANVAFTYTLTKSGGVIFKGKEDPNLGYWVEDITGYSFMPSTWLGDSITESTNEFLIPGAKGEAETSIRTHKEALEEIRVKKERTTKQP